MKFDTSSAIYFSIHNQPPQTTSNKNNTFWFRDTQEIHTFISTLTQQRDQLSLTDLEQYRDRLRTMITSTS